MHAAGGLVKSSNSFGLARLSMLKSPLLLTGRCTQREALISLTFESRRCACEWRSSALLLPRMFRSRKMGNRIKHILAIWPKEGLLFTTALLCIFALHFSRSRSVKPHTIANLCPTTTWKWRRSLVQPVKIGGRSEKAQHIL